MKSNFVKKIIGLIIMTTTILGVGSIGASAEWRRNSDNTWSYDNVSNGWFKDNQNWYFFKNNVMQTGWLKDNDGSWYYLSSNGEMLHDTTTPDGFKVGSNGIYIVNNTVNNANSNNTTNLTNNVDNSTKSSSDITLNNTGSITNNTTNNNVDVNVNSDAQDAYYKQLAKTQKAIEKARTEQLAKTQEANEKTNEAIANNNKAYYQLQLENMKNKLDSAKASLENAKSQKTVKTYVKQADGSWQFDYLPDKDLVNSAQSLVDYYSNQVEYYKKLIG
jgi:hypothetical protein